MLCSPLWSDQQLQASYAQTDDCNPNCMQPSEDFSCSCLLFNTATFASDDMLVYVNMCNGAAVENFGNM